MDTSRLKDAGIHVASLVDAAECEDYITKLNDDPNWTTALVHYSQAKGHPGVYKPKMRIAEANGLHGMPNMIERMDSQVQSLIVPDINRWYRTQFDTLAEHQAVRYEIGGHFKTHTDCGKHLEHRQFTIVCYLNDDFDGGETTFPDFDLAVKPKTGMAITFPSEYRHSAKPVLKGKKYVYLCWVIKPNEPIKWI